MRAKTLADMHMRTPPLNTADMLQLASSCSHLEQLSISFGQANDSSDEEEDARAEDADEETCSLLGLQQATRLTSLCITACGPWQDIHLVELATLTALQHLVISCDSDDDGFTDGGVLELTFLTALTHLVLRGFCADTSYVSRAVGGYERDDEYGFKRHFSCVLGQRQDRYAFPYSEPEVGLTVTHADTVHSMVVVFI